MDEPFVILLYFRLVLLFMLVRQFLHFNEVRQVIQVFRQVLTKLLVSPRNLQGLDSRLNQLRLPKVSAKSWQQLPSP